MRKPSGLPRQVQRSVQSGGKQITLRHIFRFGLATLGFTLLGVALFVGFSNYFLNQRVQAEVRKIRKLAREYPALNYLPEMNRGLPVPLQRYFRFVQQDSFPRSNVVEIDFRGEREKSPRREVWQTEGTIYCVTTRPVFLSFATLKKGPLYWAKSRQRYWLGEGISAEKLFASVTLDEQEGTEVSRALLFRYLTLLPLFPRGLLPGPFLRWEARDSLTCVVIATDEYREVHARVRVDAAGRISEISGPAGPGGQGTTWTVRYRDYRLQNGHRVPTRVEAETKRADGGVVRLRFRVERIRYGWSGE